MKRTALVVACAALLLGAQSLLAQWPAFVPPGTPRAADGSVDMNAPAPRTPDGKIDFSGVWQTAGGGGRGRGGRAGAPGGGAGGRGAADATAPVAPGGSLFGDIGAQTPGGAPYLPWAAELVKQRMADGSKDNPDAHCLPLGILQNTTHPFPKKILQTPSELILIYEGSGTTVREVYLDGRTLPDPDAQPWYQGYSVGRWEGDTLVVETSNFIDDDTWTTWLDVRGSPLSQHGKLTERIRRPSFGTLEIEVTIDDPKVYTRPFTAAINSRLLPDTQLIEFVCIDKSAQHYVGATGVPDAVPSEQKR